MTTVLADNLIEYYYQDRDDKQEKKNATMAIAMAVESLYRQYDTSPTLFALKNLKKLILTAIKSGSDTTNFY